MARKKCPHCQTCYTVFWFENNRYYHCWLCNLTLAGMDSGLYEVEDPRRSGILVEEKEQEDETQG